MKFNIHKHTFQFILGMSLTFITTSVFAEINAIPAKGVPIVNVPVVSVPVKDVPVRDVTLIGDNQITKDVVMSLIDHVLPQWDESILKAKSKENPVNHLSFNDIIVTLNDQPFKEKPPTGATQIDDGDRAVKIDQSKGKVRYVSRTRSWNFEKDAETLALSESEAHDIALKSLSQLGFPMDEMEKSLVKTQMAGGAKAGARELQDIYEMYRLVYIQRQINDLPVYGNNINVAVSNEGDIQRMGINWSTFNINQESKLRSREEVISEAANEIMIQDPDSAIEIKAQLAYASPSERNSFKPVAILFVNSLPSPYEVLVELTNLADTHDKE